MSERVSVFVLDAKFSIDTAKPCPYGKGTIEDNNCGERREGSMYPFCYMEGNRCPQVVIELYMRPASEVLRAMEQNHAREK